MIWIQINLFFWGSYATFICKNQLCSVHYEVHSFTNEKLGFSLVIKSNPLGTVTQEPWVVTCSASWCVLLIRHFTSVSCSVNICPELLSHTDSWGHSSGLHAGVLGLFFQVECYENLWTGKINLNESGLCQLWLFSVHMVIARVPTDNESEEWFYFEPCVFGGCWLALPPLALQPVGSAGGLYGLDGLLEELSHCATHCKERPNVCNWFVWM